MIRINKNRKLFKIKNILKQKIEDENKMRKIEAFREKTIPINLPC